MFVLFVFYCLLFVFYLHTHTHTHMYIYIYHGLEYVLVIFCFIKPLKNVSRTLIAIAIINVTLPGNNLCDKLTYFPLLIFNDHKNMISKYIYYWSHTSRKQRV